jgi:hypothetical protein
MDNRTIGRENTVHCRIDVFHIQVSQLSLRKQSDWVEYNSQLENFWKLLQLFYMLRSTVIFKFLLTKPDSTPTPPWKVILHTFTPKCNLSNSLTCSRSTLCVTVGRYPRACSRTLGSTLGGADRISAFLCALSACRQTSPLSTRLRWKCTCRLQPLAHREGVSAPGRPWTIHVLWSDVPTSPSLGSLLWRWRKVRMGGGCSAQFNCSGCETRVSFVD